MRKFNSVILVVLILALLLPTLAFAQTFDLASMSNEELSALSAAIVAEQQSRNQSDTGYIVSGNLGKCFVGLKEVKYDKDRAGNNVVILVYDFSHTKEEAKDFTFSIATTVYQDGVECDANYYFSDDNSLRKVKAGVTIEVSKVFTLSSDSPIEIEIEELISFSGEKLTATHDVKQ